MNKGIEKAALLLLALDKAEAKEVIDYLDPEQLETLTKTIQTFSEVNKSQVEHLMADFLSDLKQQSSKNETLVEAGVEDLVAMRQLQLLSEKDVALLLEGESSQLIANVLITFSASKVAKILSFYSLERNANILLRMSALSAPSPKVMETLNTIIAIKLEERMSQRTQTRKGASTIAEIIKHFDLAQEDALVEEIKSSDPKTGERISAEMFGFESILKFDNLFMQKLLQKIPTSVLFSALKGGSVALQNKVLLNLPKKDAQILKTRLDTQGPITVSEIENAHEDILHCVKKLSKELIDHSNQG